MTTDEMRKYWRPARNNLFPDDTGFYPDPLDVALGVNFYSKWYNSQACDDRPLTEDMRWLLVKLAGPHGKTILKAYRVQRGL